MGRGDALASGAESASFTPGENISPEEYAERVGTEPKPVREEVAEETPVTQSALGIEEERVGEYVPERDLTYEENNIIWAGATGFEASWSEVIVLQDEWQSGLECKTCQNKVTRTIGGKDLSVIRCEDCAGHGKRGDKKCSTCEGRGDVVCPECHGKGGVLVAPEMSKSEPTTGRVVSVGPRAEGFTYGDRVMYMNYSGNLFRLTIRSKVSDKKVNLSLRIIHDRDIRCKMHGHLNASELRAALALHTNE